jgi:hypothetical protein
MRPREGVVSDRVTNSIAHDWFQVSLALPPLTVHTGDAAGPSGVTGIMGEFS